MRRRWDHEELEWARECWRSGDSIEEIAEWSNRTMAEVVMVLGSGCRMTPTEREVLSLYMAGCTFAEIDHARGANSAGKPFKTRVPGKAAASIITNLRRKGISIPLRNARAA